MRDAIETHLRHQPVRLSRSRIKRLRGVERPQYRLRVDDVRIFYDVTGSTVEVLGIVAKMEADKFASEDDWFDYRLENDSRFLQRIRQARSSLRSGRGMRLEDVD